MFQRGAFIRHKASPRTLFCATSMDPAEAWAKFEIWLGRTDQSPADYEFCLIMDGSDGLQQFPVEMCRPDLFAA